MHDYREFLTRHSCLPEPGKGRPKLFKKLVLGRASDPFSRWRDLGPRSAADDEEPLVLQESVCPGDGVQVDAEIPGKATHRWERLSRKECPRCDELSQLMGYLRVDWLFKAAVDGDGKHHENTVYRTVDRCQAR